PLIQGGTGKKADYTLSPQSCRKCEGARQCLNQGGITPRQKAWTSRTMSQDIPQSECRFGEIFAVDRNGPHKRAAA
ncbi:MAG: hypothetical protein WBV56_08685, partial [Azonexus sp.]